MLAKEIMTKEVLTVSPQTSVQEVAKLLIEHKISGVPVTENGKLVGIISEGDLIIKDKKLHIPSVINVLGSIIYLESPKKLEEELKKITAVVARDLMTKVVFTLNEDSDIADVATLMSEKRINRVPIVKGEEIVGIISRGDIIKSLARD